MSLLLRTCVAASSRNVIIQEFSSLPRTSHLNLERKCLSLWHRCARCHHHLLSKGFKETSQLFTYTSAPRLMSFRGLCNRTWSRKLLGNNAYINNVIRRVYSTRAEVIKEAGELSKQGRNAVKAVKRIPQVNEIKRLFGLAKSEKMKLAGKHCVQLDNVYQGHNGNKCFHFLVLSWYFNVIYVFTLMYKKSN